MLLHLHVRPVEGADSQRAVKGKLHITGAGSFRACEGDLFRQVCCRNDQLRQADAVVGDKDHLQLVANLRIVINHRRHIVDQVNNVLGHIVGRGRLTGENIHRGTHSACGSALIRL